MALPFSARSERSSICTCRRHHIRRTCLISSGCSLARAGARDWVRRGGGRAFLLNHGRSVQKLRPLVINDSKAKKLWK